MDEVVFGRYRLLSLIGAGAMGKVYKAHDTVMGRDVAIKVLPNELGAEPGYRERFRREAHTAARLTEPHIIPIHDTGEIEGQLYLVMPVIEGIDVQALLQRDGPMSPERAVQVIEQLAAALDAAHAAGLVHRDVKPSNALVTARDFVYLIDFGIAHNAAATKLTSTGMIMGTLRVHGAGTLHCRHRRRPLRHLRVGVCAARMPHRLISPIPARAWSNKSPGTLTLDPPTTKRAPTRPTRRIRRGHRPRHGQRPRPALSKRPSAGHRRSPRPHRGTDPIRAIAHTPAYRPAARSRARSNASERRQPRVHQPDAGPQGLAI